MVDSVLNWVLRGILAAFGAGALLGMLWWLRNAFRGGERWAVRLGIGMMLLAGLYAWGHTRLLGAREEIEDGRQMYAKYGDPRLAELNRAEVRGWVTDCTGRDAEALAGYAVDGGEVKRQYPLGEAGANLIGGGDSAEVRDYTVERTFAEALRKPAGFRESTELHPAGTDVQLTLCRDATQEAARLLRRAGRQGTVIVQDVRTGALVAYAATGTASQPPYGIKRYSPPGSVFKLALSAVWWDHGMGDQMMSCPPRINVNGKDIRNFESHEYASLEAPHGMLVVSCNTLAIQMALMMHDQLGADEIGRQFRSFGFIPYAGKSPTDPEHTFWNTSSRAWARRMDPPPSRVRFAAKYNPFEWAQIAIGQGPVDVTPMAVSRFIQAIGNGGVMMQPTIEAALVPEKPEGRRVMKAATATKLLDAMVEVVHKGTAISTVPLLEDIDWDMGGKTGTADIRRGAVPEGWFAGLIVGPDRRARYTVVVLLHQGGQGGRLPAGIAAGMTRFFAAKDAAARRAAAAPATPPGRARAREPEETRERGAATAAPAARTGGRNAPR
ncbi:MAG TPA: penicillin-binding transpeptidase domain-containing protein [Longimicrobiaceae bacterium]|nr:penicillin-binding transpeptidase domain-containing protein [Longimicrobiaceae bacterium]